MIPQYWAYHYTVKDESSIDFMIVGVVLHVNAVTDPEEGKGFKGFKSTPFIRKFTINYPLR
jgi:hypothetical protein